MKAFSRSSELIVDMAKIKPEVLETLRKDSPLHENNIAPRNWTPMSESEFAQSKWFMYPWDKVEYRQVHRSQEGLPVAVEKRRGGYFPQMLAVRIFSYTNCSDGYAIGSSHMYAQVYYFHWGCDHKFSRELTRLECKDRGVHHYGAHFHVHQCIKCGDIWSYDSSG